MSPLQIHALLEIYARPLSADQPNYQNPATYGETNKMFFQKGLIEQIELTNEQVAEGHASVRCTDKGTFYVNALCNMPMPITSYRIPEWIGGPLRMEESHAGD